MRTALANDDTGPLDLMPGPSGQPSPAPVALQVVQSGRREPLSRCVEDALRVYLQTTGGHGILDLHRLVIEEVERPLFATVLQHVEGNLSQAAKILGLTRSTLRKRLRDYGIERDR